MGAKGKNNNADQIKTLSKRKSVSHHKAKPTGTMNAKPSA